MSFIPLFLFYEVIDFLNHEQYIKRCLEIAQKGIGFTRPNPSVGAVVVSNGKIIGEGYTSAYGGNHAEVNAIESVKDVELLKEATIYVTLEPCSHHGKTPPCSDLIIEKGIPEVVIGCVDSNSVVAGKGISRLEKAGCKVTVGVLEQECKEHHRRFFTFHELVRPYIVLKWAESKDGFIAPLKRDERKPVWISGEVSRQLVHQWRSQEHAILVGTKTVIEDNPKLDVRNWKGQNPVRIIIDRELKISKNSNVYDGSVKTIFITEKEREASKELFFEKVDFSKPLAKEVCKVLHKHQIQSVLVEGGSQTLQTFINEGLWDEAKVFVGKDNLVEGVKAPTFTYDSIALREIENDQLKIYRND
ncbi:bifunctional diaminohydroxyphosphoribosylaminopyrimidine deaminase/5-amino-6-(5-phosphoribosylamino)uracil reductase RibD [Pseudotenacibaculum sp. MALMAid0570]